MLLFLIYFIIVDQTICKMSNCNNTIAHFIFYSFYFLLILFILN